MEPLNHINISGVSFGEQRVSILLNAELYYVGDVPPNGLFSIDISVVPISHDGVYEIVFYWPDARHWNNSDTRKLAFDVKKIHFD